MPPKVYSGAVVRTTHLTGTVTDLGIEIGVNLFQGDRSGTWKLKVYIIREYCRKAVLEIFRESMC